MTTSISGTGVVVQAPQLQNVQSERFHGEKNNVQEISAFAKNDRNLSLMMDFQSLRTDTSRAISAAKNLNGVDSTATSLSQANKAEPPVMAMPEMLTPPINSAQPNSKHADEPDSARETSVSTISSSSGGRRSQPAVEGGTDITETNAAEPLFRNVVGSTKQMAVMNIITKVMAAAERDGNVAAAAAIQRGVAAAERAGKNNVEAARDQLSSAITSGTMSFVGQAATVTHQVKALNKEGRSITNNLKAARDLELGVRNNRNRIESAKDKMVHQNNTLSVEVEATMTMSHAPDMHRSSLMHDEHNRIQLVTQKAHAIAEYGNQGIRSGQGLVEGSFGISAAEKQKEAELARADREVNNEVASLQGQTAKKAAETLTAMLSMTDSVLNTNSSTVSSIAGTR
ncbi:type III secretion system protein [Enterobacter cloacae]|uniref:type III secretion system protein n=1 Tax=Enterobacter cloacae TaxID=550 RepID=UPI002FFCF543